MSINNQFHAKMVEVASVQAGALVDIETGQCLTTWGSMHLDIARVAEHHAAMFRSQLRALVEIGWNDELEDIQLILARHCHILCFIPEGDSLGLFLLVILDRARTDIHAAYRYLAETASNYQLNEVERMRLDSLRNPFNSSPLPRHPDETGAGRLPFMSEKAVMGLLESP